MSSTLVVVFVALLGVVTSFAISGFIHLLLVLAVDVGLIRVSQGRRPISG